MRSLSISNFRELGASDELTFGTGAPESISFKVEELAGSLVTTTGIFSVVVFFLPEKKSKIELSTDALLSSAMLMSKPSSVRGEKYSTQFVPEYPMMSTDTAVTTAFERKPAWKSSITGLSSFGSKSVEEPEGKVLTSCGISVTEELLGAPLLALEAALLPALFL